MPGAIEVRRLLGAGLALVGLVLASFAATAEAGHPGESTAGQAVEPLANRCVTLRAPDGRYVEVAGDSYVLGDRSRRAAARIHLKPTGLGTYLLHDEGGRLLSAADPSTIERRSAERPDAGAEWALPRRGNVYAIRSLEHRADLTRGSGGELSLAPIPRDDRDQRFRIRRAGGCERYPEAGINARGRPKLERRDGSVFGYADLHLHVTADLRAGGQVISGAPFHRFGISQALGNDASVHGPDGSLDVTGNLLRDGNPVGTHDTAGWPTFTGWPAYDTYTHQQAYYRWLRRGWKSGLRLVVAQVIEDEPLCDLQPRRSHSCDEMETIKLGIRRLQALERYVDAQSGGRGRGWFRLVYNPRQARRAIDRGQLAVVIGTETSSPLDCTSEPGAPTCTNADVDERLAELRELGVRSMFVSHWVDNQFTGAALQSGATGQFIDAMQLSYVGRPFETEPCTTGDEADGTCNSLGLTELGEYLLRRMAEERMLIEADHLSQRAKTRALEIAVEEDYPLVTSHTNTGGEWTDEHLRTLRRLGGLPTATPETTPKLAEKINGLRAQGSQGLQGRPRVALGSDTGGFAAQPGPREDADADPLVYPFPSFDQRVMFDRQRTGERSFDLNTDGVAHYGLVPDLLEDTHQHEGGTQALHSLFGSAEAYLRMWERANRRP